MNRTISMGVALNLSARSAHWGLRGSDAVRVGPPDRSHRRRSTPRPTGAFPPGSRWSHLRTGRNGHTTDRVASEIGVEILRRGGNAVDAAVATHFALAVVNPEAGNIGGGGFMVVPWPTAPTAALDFREKAPLAATRDMYLDAGGTDRSSTSGTSRRGCRARSRGCGRRTERFGSLPWAELVQPAINLADGDRGARAARGARCRATRSGCGAIPATAAALLPGGRAPRVGDRLEQRDLGETLRRIAVATGRTASTRPHGRAHRGGDAPRRRIITREDLAPTGGLARPLSSSTTAAIRVISMPPPSSGGATLARCSTSWRATIWRRHAAI
jgi:gamma-glutamyltranspeptidase / glutathione hydrolase